MHIAHDTAAASSLWRQRERLGDLEAYAAPRKTDRAQWAEDTTDARLGTEALIDALGENNPILRDMLETAKQEIYTAGVENAVVDEEAAAAYAAATRRHPPPRWHRHRRRRRHRPPQTTAAGSCSARSTTCA